MLILEKPNPIYGDKANGWHDLEPQCEVAILCVLETDVDRLPGCPQERGESLHGGCTTEISEQINGLTGTKPETISGDQGYWLASV